MDKFDSLVDALSSLPTVGKKSAIRFAYHMVLKDSFGALKLANAIEEAITSISRCNKCGNLSENEFCEICCDEQRDESTLCIVENIKDIYIIEKNGEYNGLYFVLENIEDETISKLIDMVKDDICEIIFAFSPSCASTMAR